jgi:HAD superfamily hydrolase (TIGR01509 family)
MGVQFPPGTPQFFHVKQIMNLPNNIKAVMFDMDGVIFNTEDIAHEVFSLLAERFNSVFNEDHHKAILGTSEKFWSEYICNTFQFPLSPEEFRNEFWNEMYRASDSQLRLMSGIPRIFDELEEKGIKIALVTSTPMHQTKELLEKFGLFDRFLVKITGDQIKNGKPDPEPYVKAIQMLNLQAHECVVIEDAISGVKSGKAAGCYVIAVPTKHALGLDYSMADRIVSSLDDI